MPSLSRVPHAWWFRAAMLFNLLCYGLYFVHLQADFPNDSPWNDFAKYTDEGWYGGAALHRLQTGCWYIPNGFNPAVGLPTWPVMLTGWFALFGAGITAARALTVLLLGASLLLVFLLLRPLVGRLAAALAVTLVLVNPYCYSFDRLALLEPVVVLLFLLALWLATVPDSSGNTGRLLRAAAVGALVTAAVLAKTTAIVLLPALLYQLWATASGPLPRPLPSEGRLHRLLRHVRSHRRALLLPLIASIVADALWGPYFFLLVTPHHLADYRQLFAINAGKAHGRILLEVMARALGDTLWINRILLPLAMLAVAASTRFLRELWRTPLYTSSVLALVATVGFIGWHTWFQPRYYLLCVFPAVIVLVLALHALRKRARRLERTSPWRIAHRVAVIAVEVAVATMLLQTARYALHPQYTLRDTAADIAVRIHAAPAHPPVLLAGSGDTMCLFNGVRAANPEWPMGGLPALLRQEQPGWFAAFSPLEDKRVTEMAKRYTLQPVATYRVFDEPEHRVFTLYRLVPPR